jgi:hypothetical protein
MMDCDADSLANNLLHVSTIIVTIYLSVELKCVCWGILGFEDKAHGRLAGFLPERGEHHIISEC